MKNNQPIMGLILVGLTLFLMVAMSSCSTFKGGLSHQLKETKTDPDAVEGVIKYAGVDMILPGGWYVYTAWTIEKKAKSLVTRDSSFIKSISELESGGHVNVQGIELNLMNFSQESYLEYVKEFKKAKLKNPKQNNQMFDLESWLALGGKRFYQMNGCIIPKSGTDSDNDGIPNQLDLDNHSTEGARIDANGKEVDSDGDGIPDSKDLEANTPKGSKVDSQGVIIVETKSETKPETKKPSEPTSKSTSGKASEVSIKGKGTEGGTFKSTPKGGKSEWPTIRK